MTTITHKTIALLGLDAHPVTITASTIEDPLIKIEGLPNTSERELRVRIVTALSLLGIDAKGVAITFETELPSLLPAAHLDLPTVLCVLAAMGRVPAAYLDTTAMHPALTGLFFGELSLSGQLRAVRGILPLLQSEEASKASWIVVPSGNKNEASFCHDARVYHATSLQKVFEHLTEVLEKTVPLDHVPLVEPEPAAVAAEPLHVDAAVLRALAAAVTGGHNLLLVGPPGSGKTLVARYAAALLPPLTRTEMLETSAVYSAAGLLGEEGLVRSRPFRAPHHSVSVAGLLGGGERPRPGEVSLAHNGVLFLDELPEFRASAIDSLKRVLRDGQATIARANVRVGFPARPLVIASTNPCPCGYLGHPRRTCHCQPAQIKRHREQLRRMCGDLFDIQVNVSPLELAQPAQDVEALRADVSAARDTASVPPGSGRTVRVLRIAHTLARLDKSAKVTDRHMLEAWQLFGEVGTPDHVTRGQLLHEMMTQQLEVKS